MSASRRVDPPPSSNAAEEEPGKPESRREEEEEEGPSTEEEKPPSVYDGPAGATTSNTNSLEIGKRSESHRDSTFWALFITVQHGLRRGFEGS